LIRFSPRHAVRLFLNIPTPEKGFVRDSYESRIGCLLSWQQKHKQEGIMARGDKDKYTDKQKRKAEHIEEGYKERGVSEEEAERRAWATVNAMHHGGEKPGGGGYGKPENKEPARKGGRKGGRR
jgi:plasmid stabilization system protein ParE